jgi:DNA repair protein RadC
LSTTLRGPSSGGISKRTRTNQRQLSPFLHQVTKDRQKLIALQQKRHWLTKLFIAFGTDKEAEQVNLHKTCYLMALEHSARYVDCGITGHPSSSEADLRLTRRILEASKILQLQLIDHVIIGSAAPGRSSYFSFKRRGRHFLMEHGFISRGATSNETM